VTLAGNELDLEMFFQTFSKILEAGFNEDIRQILHNAMLFDNPF